MDKKTLGLALFLLIAAAGCGKHAAATLLGHPAETPARHPEAQTEKGDPRRENCKRTSQLFC